MEGIDMKLRYNVAMVFVVVMAAFFSGCAQPASVQPQMTVPETTPQASATATDEPTAPATLLPTATPTPVVTHTAEPAEEPVPGAPVISEKEIVYSNGDVNVSMVCPEISGMKDQSVQRSINKEIYETLSDMAKSVEEKSKEDTQLQGQHPLYDISAIYRVQRNDGVVLSIQISISTYTGGANTGSDSMFINVINTKDAAQPTLAVLFTEGVDYTTAINNEINTIIQNDDFMAESVNFETVSPTQWYYLTDTSLVIMFPRYEIAAGVIGEPEFIIPLENLTRILIPEVK